MYNTWMRNFNLFDNLVIKADSFLNIISSNTTNFKSLTSNNYPAKNLTEPKLNTTQKQNSISMMRVDQAGEVCAQALYHGQSFITKDNELKRHFKIAAKEEEDHLTWCAIRLQELGGKVSLLNPIWAAGSFTIGAVAGLFGDKYSLGFLEETEYQVTEHLNKQLDNLAIKDNKTRKIIEQMRDDELKHAKDAHNKGAHELPGFVKQAMKHTAKIMTKIASYI